MECRASDSPISWTFPPLVDPFEPPFGHLPSLQAHSPLSCPDSSFSHHPPVAQRIQREALRCVCDPDLIPSPAIAELALEQPVGVFHFGPNAGLALFQLVDQGVYSVVLLQSPALTRHHGNLQVHPRMLRWIFALGDTPLAGVCEYNIFFTLQQGVGLSDVMLIGRSACDRLNLVRPSVCVNVRFYIEVPLIALLGLVHPWITLLHAVIGGAGSCDQSGIKDRARFEQKAPLNQLGVIAGKNLRGQVVGFKQVTGSENGALIRQARSACVNMPNHFCMKRMRSIGARGKRRRARFTCRRKGLDQASQLSTRHSKILHAQKLTLACSLDDQFESGTGEGGFFHEDITFKSGAKMTFAVHP